MTSHVQGVAGPLWGCWTRDPQQHPWLPGVLDVACGYDLRLADRRCEGCWRSRAESASCGRRCVKAGVQLDLFDGRRKKRNAAPRTSEHQEQVALMQWAALSVGRWPELALLHAIPNGGWRHPAVAAGLRREGVKPGVPDLDLPVARGPWHGLRIELKASDGVVSDVQRWWIGQLRAQGYRAEVCRGWLAARDLIIEYLGV